MLTLCEIAERLGVCTATVKVWRRNGLLRAHAYNDKNECFYELPDADAPVKHKRKGLSHNMRCHEEVPHVTDEVQYEA